MKSCQKKNQDDMQSAENGEQRPNLFSELKIGSVKFRNRIGVSPMCQYFAHDGFANDWHLVHLGSRAVGGAGLVIAEATAVEARGRISPDDLGIYKDEHISKLKQITEFVSSFGAIPGIQIAHAGRKGSCNNPWRTGIRDALSDADGGWQVVGPTTTPFSDRARKPEALSVDEIKQTVELFAKASERALEAGFKFLELHAAHGYLLHSFYSPLTNERTDEYGGSFENRIKFLLEVVGRVRQNWPQSLPLSVRISATEWVDGGWTVEDSIELAKVLKGLGVDIIDCSSGNIRSGDRYNMTPAWQVPLAEAVRKGADIRTAAVGMITDANQANQIIQESKADLVLLAREMMRDPYWPYHAAKTLGIESNTLPSNYTFFLEN